MSNAPDRAATSIASQAGVRQASFQPEEATDHARPVSSSPNRSIARSCCARWASGPKLSNWPAVLSRNQRAHLPPFRSSSDRGVLATRGGIYRSLPVFRSEEHTSELQSRQYL